MTKSTASSIEPFPKRYALGSTEKIAIDICVSHYEQTGEDPSYQGIFEKRYTDAFCVMMGGGYADAVCTGSCALFVALRALNLPPLSSVLVSPITDPGTLAAIVFNNLVPKLIDSIPESYGTGLNAFVDRWDRHVTGAVLVHSLGRPIEDIELIMQAARHYNIKVVEDCSQAHGAKVHGKPVGSFGDIAAFSTMYRKAHMTGGSGGLIYTRDLDLYRQALAHADRGKPRWEPGFNDRDPNSFLFPALNFHTDELSCAIGEASLRRLDDTILRRLTFVAEFSGRLREKSLYCKPYGYSPNDSPFIYPVIVDTARLLCSKMDFAEALLAKGIPLNPHYGYLVSDWKHYRRYMADDFDTPNARSVRDRSFCLYLNENYGLKEAVRCVNAIVEVEKKYGRPSV